MYEERSLLDRTSPVHVCVCVWGVRVSACEREIGQRENYVTGKFCLTDCSISRLTGLRYCKSQRGGKSNAKKKIMIFQRYLQFNENKSAFSHIDLVTETIPRLCLWVRVPHFCPKCGVCLQKQAGQTRYLWTLTDGVWQDVSRDSDMWQPITAQENRAEGKPGMMGRIFRSVPGCEWDGRRVR